jgi:hypothetical protein
MNNKDPIKEITSEQTGSGAIDLRAGAGVVWLLSCILALGISALLMKAIFRNIMSGELFSGWGLASVNAVLAVMINITAMRKKDRGFVVWGAAGNLLRAMGVLVIILLVKLLSEMKFEPFIMAFLVGYFVFMFADTIRMNALNMSSKGGK